MFSVFGESMLDPINTSASSSEITAWKRSPKTSECFKNLFLSINGEPSYSARILEKIWPKSDCSEVLLAFAIAICETIFNPSNDVIQINETIMKPAITINKVSSNSY